jgi:hypothetical protein
VRRSSPFPRGDISEEEVRGKSPADLRGFFFYLMPVVLVSVEFTLVPVPDMLPVVFRLDPDPVVTNLPES